MIKINKSDSIVDIILKIKDCKDKDIILEFPFWHPVLHNFTSLKILKNKSHKKDLIIITNDKTAKKIGKKIWIKYSLINNPDLIEYNYTFFEYFIYTFKSYFREIKDIFLQKNENTLIWKYHKKYWNWRIWYFISFSFISFFLLIFIFYFAVNKTYIYITPEIEVKTKAQNFIFTEMWEDEIINDENIIKLRKISKIVSLSSIFWTSWVSEDSVSTSRWEVILYNKFNEKIDLLPNTRIESWSWVVFLIEWWASIPWSSVSASWTIIPWETKVYAKSRVHDSSWKITWIRWNITKWTNVFFPWLKDDIENVYWVTNLDFVWANNNYVKILTEEDIKNAKDILKSKLESESLKQLKKDIEESNNNNNVKYKILWIDNIINYSNLKITGYEKLKKWDKIDNFELHWTVRITTYSYNNEFLLNKIKNSIKQTTLKEVEEILQINNDSLRIANVLWEDKYPSFRVKATTQVEVLFIHNFLSKSNNYVNKLKNIVAWLDEENAEKILLNNNKISNVDIEIRPFFINRVSKISDNIIFKVLKD